jgi:predicted HTH domain antitoxin
MKGVENMQKVLSIRLEKSDLDFVESEAAEEKVDKAKVLRALVESGRLQFAIEQYKGGKISLGKAAEKAGISISEMMDKLAELGIKNRMTKEQYLQGIKNIKEVEK